MGKAKYLFWIDLETTGTSEILDPILEAAWIITEKRAPFTELSSGSLVIEPHPGVWPQWESRLDDYVRNMHQQNGLLADIEFGRGVYIDDAQDAIISQLSLYGRPHDYLIAGSGVSHFDRRMIKVQMPRVEKWLQYPSFDVGVVRRGLELLDNSESFINETYGANIAVTEGTQHRANDDIRDHLNEWRVYAHFLQLALNERQAWMNGQ